jgi:hypothetical protein
MRDHGRWSVVDTARAGSWPNPSLRHELTSWIMPAAGAGMAEGVYPQAKLALTTHEECAM